MEKLSVLVVSFDGYKDVWNTFFDTFKISWKNCPYQAYLVTNYEKPNYDNVCILATGEEFSWCDRMRKALKEIDSEFVLLLLEDYFICQEVDNKKFQALFSNIQKSKILYCRLNEIPKVASGSRKENNLGSITSYDNYEINLQPAIWKKEFLMKLLQQIDGNAWKFETSIKDNKVAITDDELAHCVVDTGKTLVIMNGILKGKWFHSIPKRLKRMGIVLDTSHRGTLSKLEELKFDLSNVIDRSINITWKKRIKRLLKKAGVHFYSES